MTVNAFNVSVNAYQNKPVKPVYNGGLGGLALNPLSETADRISGLRADRRFDSFINQVSGDFIQRLNQRIESGLMKIVCMNAEDRAYVAAMHKDNMKRLAKEAIEHEEKELERFKDLKAQKDHYQSVLNDNGYVRSGKYALGGMNNTRIPENKLRELIDSVQEKIDDIVNAKVAKENDPLDVKTFEYLYSGAAFLAAADMRGNAAAVVNDSSISGQWTRSEDTYIEEAQRSMDSLNQRLKDIDKMYNSFRRDGDFSKRVSTETPLEKVNKIKTLAFVFDQWNKSTMQKLAEIDDLNKEELLISLEKYVN